MRGSACDLANVGSCGQDSLLYFQSLWECCGRTGPLVAPNSTHVRSDCLRRLTARRGTW